MVCFFCRVHCYNEHFWRWCEHNCAKFVIRVSSWGDATTASASVVVHALNGFHEGCDHDEHFCCWCEIRWYVFVFSEAYLPQQTFLPLIIVRNSVQKSVAGMHEFCRGIWLLFRIHLLVALFPISMCFFLFLRLLATSAALCCFDYVRLPRMRKVTSVLFRDWK